MIRFSVPIGPDFTADDVRVSVDRTARQVCTDMQKNGSFFEN